MAPVRVARAFRLPMMAAMAALALSSCMRASGPVATVQQPRSDLDSLAYGQPYGPAPRVAVAYAAAPLPVAYDVAYRLDAGDKLRDTVFVSERWF
jgi:polysaccharide biosynthesis/export protein